MPPERQTDESAWEEYKSIVPKYEQMPPTDGGHVAWCRYIKQHEKPTRIQLCDSDAEGAFAVYRHPQPSPTPEPDRVDVDETAVEKLVRSLRSRSERLIGMLLRSHRREADSGNSIVASVSYPKWTRAEIEAELAKEET